MNREFARQLCLAYRRAFGKTSLDSLLARFGIDPDMSQLSQQDKVAKLVAALRGELPADAIARAQALADKPPSDDNGPDMDDDGEAAAASTPKNIEDINTADVYAKWNSAGKAK